MKKPFLILLLLIGGSVSLFAQTATTSDIKPAEGTFGFTAGITGLANISPVTNNATGTVGFRYILANGLAARLSVNLSTNHSDTTFTAGGVTNTTGVKVTNTTNSAGTMAIALGIQKSWAGTDRLDPYIGADLVIGRVGGGKTDQRSEVLNADSTFDPNDKTGDFSETVNKNASGISIGIVPCVGFNYFFAKHFSFGAEFGWGFFFRSLSGGSTETSGTVGGVAQPTITRDNQLSSPSNGFRTVGSGTLNFSVYY